MCEGVSHRRVVNKGAADRVSVVRSRTNYCTSSLMGRLESDSHGSKGHLCRGYGEGLWPGSMHLEK